MSSISNDRGHLNTREEERYWRQIKARQQKYMSNGGFSNRGKEVGPLPKQKKASQRRLKVKAK